MFGDKDLAEKVASIISEIDQGCRRELCDNTIVNERDYVSILTSRIREKLRSEFDIKCFAKTLDGSAEKKIGVDGIFIFKVGGDIKIGLFEAKRLRMQKEGAISDEFNSIKNSNRFISQINRQRVWANECAIWEMFFVDLEVGEIDDSFVSEGSTCVWHKDTYRFKEKNKLGPKIFNKATLKELLKEKKISIKDIVVDIILCKAGKRQQIAKNGTIELKSLDKGLGSISIPLPRNFLSKSDLRIDSFMRENNLDSYTAIDFKE